jgi:hypothetical protein
MKRLFVVCALLVLSSLSASELKVLENLDGYRIDTQAVKIDQDTKLDLSEPSVVQKLAVPDAGINNSLGSGNVQFRDTGISFRLDPILIQNQGTRSYK